jgi:hypothetical protein
MNEAIQWMEANLKIRDKFGDIIPLKLNKQQTRIVNRAETLRLAGLPVRLLILKTRQVGVTTAIQGYFRYLQREGKMTSCSITDRASSAQAVMNIAECMLDNMPDTPKLVKRNHYERNIEYTNGGCSRFKTADIDGHNMRGQTYELLHELEVAFWEKSSVKPVDWSLSPNTPGICFKESTGNGVNHFLGEWLRATYGISDYLPMFFPWFDAEHATRPVTESLIHDGEERMLVTLFGLSDEQLNWRRWAIANYCGGDVSAFHCEYPAFPEEAFGLRVGAFADGTIAERVLNAMSDVSDEINRHRYADITVKVQDGRVVMTEVNAKFKPR